MHFLHISVHKKGHISWRIYGQKEHPTAKKISREPLLGITLEIYF